MMSNFILPKIQSPSCALVMPTLTWLGSMTKPSFCTIHVRVGSFSISDWGQEHTVDMMT